MDDVPARGGNLLWVKDPNQTGAFHHTGRAV